MTHPILNARPNRNGNTPQSMIAALMQLREASTQMDKAIREVMNTVAHGRNYQTVPEGERARDRDMSTLGGMRSANHFIDEWALSSAIVIQEAGA